MPYYIFVVIYHTYVHIIFACFFVKVFHALVSLLFEHNFPTKYSHKHTPTFVHVSIGFVGHWHRRDVKCLILLLLLLHPFQVVLTRLKWLLNFPISGVKAFFPQLSTECTQINVSLYRNVYVCLCMYVYTGICTFVCELSIYYILIFINQLLILPSTHLFMCFWIWVIISWR